MIAKIIFSLLKKVLFESGIYSIYTFPKNIALKSQISSNVNVFNNYSEIPNAIKEKVVKYHLINPLYYRLKSGIATLLTIQNNRDLIAYGWIQKWKPFKKKFGWFVKGEAIMLGPYWTSPDYRGRGYYSELLRKSIFLADNNLQLVIYTAKSNLKSRKGIEKEGFKFLGTFKIIFLLRCIALRYAKADDEVKM
jgi:hypothetical protein